EAGVRPEIGGIHPEQVFKLADSVRLRPVEKVPDLPLHVLLELECPRVGSSLGELGYQLVEHHGKRDAGDDVRAAFEKERRSVE
ncbi:hypothetical protein LTR16_008564, partial [Cryomyces antarcticus]